MTPHRRFYALSVLVICASLGAPAAHAQQAGGTGPNYETRLMSLEEAMRNLNGHIEQIEFAIKRLDQSMQRMQSDFDARLTKLESTPIPQPAPVAAPPPLPPQVAAPTISGAAIAPPPALADVTGTLGAVKLQDGKVTGAVNSPKAPPLPETPPDFVLTPQEQYDRAFDIVRKADYVEAEKAFKAFIDKNPKDKLIENAKYWYGETLYVQNKYADSAAAFADAYQQNPQGSKAPDCLLKLALSLSGLNKPAEACTALGELKSKYPNAIIGVRTRAKEESAKLKCGAH